MFNKPRIIPRKVIHEHSYTFVLIRYNEISWGLHFPEFCEWIFWVYFLFIEGWRIIWVSCNYNYLHNIVQSVVDNAYSGIVEFPEINLIV